MEQAVTVDAGGLVAIWATKEAKALGALVIEVHGKHATLRTSSSIDGFSKAASIPTMGPITVAAQADGTAVVTNGTTTWVLEQELRYTPITVKNK